VFALGVPAPYKDCLGVCVYGWPGAMAASVFALDHDFIAACVYVCVCVLVREGVPNVGGYVFVYRRKEDYHMVDDMRWAPPRLCSDGSRARAWLCVCVSVCLCVCVHTGGA
jgi:hypothetical protein